MITNDTAACETAHPEQALVLLEAALDVLDERGWCQHQLIEDDGHVCLAGALAEATDRLGGVYAHLVGVPTRSVAVWRLRHATGVDRPGGLITWNDEPGRTVEDVKLALKCAIAGERL